MAIKQQKNTDDEAWDKNSESSNVSANTDIKVFHGAIHNSDDYIHKLSSKTKPSEVKGKQSHYSMFKKPINNPINANQQQHQHQHQQQKSHSSSKEVDNDQLSFRNECDISKDEKDHQPIKHSAKSVDIKGLYDEESRTFQSKQNQNSATLQNLISKFKDFSDSSQVINIVNSNPNSSSFRKDSKNIQSKTYSKSVTTFRVSSIEKGIALLVSNNDCIFTMPTFLLPRGAQIGYSYSISIEETKKGIEIKNNLSLLQKAYLK